MHKLLRRLKLHMLKAKLALYRFERASVETRVVSQQGTADEIQRAVERLANIDGDIREIQADLAELFEGNGHE